MLSDEELAEAAVSGGSAAAAGGGGAAASAGKRKRGAAKAKPKRRMWSPTEETALEEGIGKHGEGKWKNMQCVAHSRCRPQLHAAATCSAAPAAPLPLAQPPAARALTREHPQERPGAALHAQRPQLRRPQGQVARAAAEEAEAGRLAGLAVAVAGLVRGRIGAHASTSPWAATRTPGRRWYPRLAMRSRRLGPVSPPTPAN